MRIFLHCNVASIRFLVFFALRAPQLEKLRFLYWHMYDFVCFMCNECAAGGKNEFFTYYFLCFVRIESVAGINIQEFSEFYLY